MWTDDQEMFRAVRARLHTAVVGDVLDTLGFFNQFLPPEVQPLREDMVVLGRAMPVLQQNISDEDSPVEMTNSQAPFGLMFEALDDLKPGEVYICTGAAAYATWGELMSTRARQLGAAGAVLDGYSRDTRGILRLNFPTFSRGRYAQDQRPRGRVVDFRVPIESNRVKIECGDVVFGDLDGVVIVPRRVEQEVFRLALEKIEKEALVQDLFQRERGSARQAFDKFGVM